MRSLSALVVAAGLFAFGCSPRPSPQPVAVATAKSSDDHGHSHDRANMLAADAGKYHAWLTAHLSQKDGNELDIFIETDETAAKPVPIPVAKFTAKAKRVSDDQEFELTFEPAPMDERPGDPAGACSHFVARVAWMKADDVLTVTAQVEIDGRPRKPTWRTFIVKKYAHHVD